MTATPRAPQVVPFEPQYREGVRALLRTAYGNSDAFDRYAAGNPLGEFLAVCALRDARVVGFNIWNRWLLHTSRGPVPVLQSGASIVDESCRGQGVFAKLLGAGEELARGDGSKYFVGFPNPASHKGFVRAGWETGRRLGLYAVSLPAVGARSGRPSVASSEGPWPFIKWRYARLLARSISVEVRGVEYRAYFTTRVAGGVNVHRLLDILDPQGRRDLRVVARVAAHLPLPGVTYLRAAVSSSNGPASVPWVIPIRRDWDTPFIFKALSTADPVEADDVRNATLAYGDIDVG